MRCIPEGRWWRAWVAALLVSFGLVGCTGDSQESEASSSAGPQTGVADQPDTTQAASTASGASSAATTPAVEDGESARPLPSVERIPPATTDHPYDWTPEDVKLLDSWGDSISDGTDLIALYERHDSELIQIRVDLLDLRDGDEPPVLIALDHRDGGSHTLGHDSDVGSFDIEWDLLISIIGGEVSLYDPAFSRIPDAVLDLEINSQLDFVLVEVPLDVLGGELGDFARLQAAIATDDAVLDLTGPAEIGATTGRAKLVMVFMNGMAAGGPSAISWYDGYDLRPDERPGELRGFRYLLDAVERYRLPLTWGDLRIELLPINEFLGINDRLLYLAGEDLFDPLAVTSYGHFMNWQPDDIDERAFDLAAGYRRNFGFPDARVAGPYEGMITPGDISVLRQGGYEAIYGFGHFGYTFGWIEDWNDAAAVEAAIRSARKIHVVNGMPFFFDPAGHYLGFVWDERWGEFEFLDQYAQLLGTDGGLDWMWRRMLHDLAIDDDQEQYFQIGTDLLLTPWMFPDVADANLGWIAAHPWIEVTTLSSILDRGWEPIDHGVIDLGPDELLFRYEYPDPANEGYNEYFPSHYYGGVSDGRAVLVPAGVEIESYYDLVPYLANGEAIPSGRIMGDDATPGSVIYETLANLRGAPDNEMARLAWLSYLNSIGEQTFHGSMDPWSGAFTQAESLGPVARGRANLVGQVNKLVAAAHWAEAAEQGALSTEPGVAAIDLDLDGEQEFTISNDRVFAIFENDGGRLEYAFAYDRDHGVVQVVAPLGQYETPPDHARSEDGEVAIAKAFSHLPDGAFVDDPALEGLYDYSVFTPATNGETLTFTSDRGYGKTFTLVEDRVCADYDGPSGELLNVGFSMSASFSGMFEPDWHIGYQWIETRDGVGWQMPSGGSGLVSAVEPFGSMDKASFIDSPAAEEQQSREDLSTYPEGHWDFVPNGRIRIADTPYGSFCLTLSALPAGS